MASFSRKKTALKASSMALLAGAHCVTIEVDRSQSVVYTGLKSSSDEIQEARRALLAENYHTFRNSAEVSVMFTDLLNDEEYYPFGKLWSAGAMKEILECIVEPELFAGESISELYDPEKAELYIDSDGEEVYVEEEIKHESDIEDLRFTFKKGYNKKLIDFSEDEDDGVNNSGSVDHWLISIINTSFHAGMNFAAQFAENSQTYYEIINDLENYEELWAKYYQLVEIYDRQLSRETKRKTGLVQDYGKD